ncbi:MAG: methionyl-tRNA formyltransferase [candidate division Zixibacteria bacterium]|nr:methionyl-tRNA formyltransferase [candidate division Zixibacteria bacterium]
MRLVFMGTPKFAVESLKRLNSSKHEMLAVVTSPDKPRGRGRKVSPTAVKKQAIEMGLPLLQPDNLKDDKFISELKQINPDLITVAAFRILPEVVYGLPRYGSINIHASLLPAYRGAAPINWALINGEEKTGLTTFFLKKQVDTGDILLQREVAITPDDDFESLHAKMMIEGAKLLLDTVNGIEDDSLKPYPQGNQQAIKAPKLTPETGLIDWNQPAYKIRNLIRGLSPYPGAYCFWNQKKLTILEVEIIAKNTDYNTGEVIESNPKKGFVIACSEDALFITRLKPQGKKALGSAEFVRGYHVKAADRFTNQR